MWHGVVYEESREVEVTSEGGMHSGGDVSVNPTNKESMRVFGIHHGMDHEWISSSSSWRGRLFGLAFVPRLIPRPSPRADNASTAALAAPSDDLLARPRDRLSAPKACALMTASVPEMWEEGEGERDVREDEVVGTVERRGRPSWFDTESLPSLPRSSDVLSARE